MSLKELISKIKLNLFFKTQNNFQKVVPLFDENSIVVDILYEGEIIYLEDNEYKEDREYIDLELGNGNKFINEAKIWYFYNKV